MSKVTRKQRQVAHFMISHQPPPHGKWAPRQRDRCIHAVLPWRPAPCPSPFLGPSTLVGAGVGSRVSEGKGLAQGTGNSLRGLPHTCVGPRSPCRPTPDPVPCFCPGLPTSDIPQRPVGLWTPSQSCCFSAESPALIRRSSERPHGSPGRGMQLCGSLASTPASHDPRIPPFHPQLYSGAQRAPPHGGLHVVSALLTPYPPGLLPKPLRSLHKHPHLPREALPTPHLLWSPHAFAT